jgi:hypothetical protein
MLGKVPQIRYVDHDINDMVKFHELAPHRYLELKHDPMTKQRIPLPRVWDKGLDWAGLLNVLDIPHFGRNNKVNSRVNLLLSYVHGGYPWLDRPISIDTILYR